MVERVSTFGAGAGCFTEAAAGDPQPAKISPTVTAVISFFILPTCPCVSSWRIKESPNRLKQA